jgi:hypothetical protein
MEETQTQEAPAQGEEKQHVQNIQKIYIKNYGNLSLDIKGTNEIGVAAYSEKRKEELFIPWSSIIMISKVEEDVEQH